MVCTGGPSSLVTLTSAGRLEAGLVTPSLEEAYLLRASPSQSPLPNKPGLFSYLITSTSGHALKKVCIITLSRLI